MPEEQVVEQQQPEQSPVPQVPEERQQQATETEKPESEKPKGGFQRRIDKLSRDKYGLVKEAAYWKGVAIGSGRVKPDDSMPTDIWLQAREAEIQNGTAAINDYAERSVEEEAERGESDSERSEPKAEQNQQQPAPSPLIPEDHPHHQRELAAAKWYADWQDVQEAAKSIPISPRLVEAVANLDNSADVAYTFAKNPELLAVLHQIPEQRAVAELAKISNLVAGRPEDYSPDGEGEQEPTSRAGQSAPAPIRPVKKPAPTATGLSDDLPIDEWVKRRNAQIRRNS